LRNNGSNTLAGYTPIKWSATKATGGFFMVPDKSGTSFILQINLKQKMNLLMNQGAIRS